MIRYDLVALGSLLFLLGHAVRAIRWRMFLPSELVVPFHRLLLCVSVGGLINAFFPIKVGDLGRALLLAATRRANLSSVLASLIFERFVDLIAIVLILAALFGLGHMSAEFVALMQDNLLLTIGALAGILLLYRTSWLNRPIYLLSAVFNRRIQIFVLDLAYRTRAMFSAAVYLNSKFMLLTMAMWLSYFLSYILFAQAVLEGDLFSAFRVFHGRFAEGVFFSAAVRGREDVRLLALAVFFLVPMVLAIAYSQARAHIEGTRILGSMLGGVRSSLDKTFLGVTSNFHGRHAYEDFLVSHFRGLRSTLVDIGLVGFAQCQIARVFVGGSGAVTAIVTQEDRFLVRKVVEPSGAGRLHEQYRWLQQKQGNPHLPVIEVSGWAAQEEFSSYQMPYHRGVCDLFEFLHQVPIEKARDVLGDIMESLHAYHLANTYDGDRPDLLDWYLEEKVRGTIGILRPLVSEFLEPTRFFVEDVPYSMQEWEFLEDLGFLRETLRMTRQCDIHGDFTIDNLLVKADGGWVAIDPNPNGVFKVPLMDWAKLLQSLHMGYESLTRGVDCAVEDDRLRFLHLRSAAYEDLYRYVGDRIVALYGEQGLRETYLHEIIHYLRLLPYKFRKRDGSGLLFFAITCKLIREFRTRYDIPSRAAV